MTYVPEKKVTQLSKTTSSMARDSSATNKQSLTQIAEEYILNAITRKAIKPGDMIDFNALAGALNMSRTPIRESMRHLHNVGIVEATTFGHFQITVLNEEKIMNYYAVRLALESEAAEISARTISNPEISILKENTAFFSRSMDNSVLLVSLDKQFHDIIYESTRNRYLMKQLRILQVFSGLIPINAFESKKRISEIYSEHCEIVRGLESRRPDFARKAMISHIRKAMEQRNG